MLNLNMGKKRRKKKVVSANGKPTVSVCTPTYNRRVFIPQLIKCFQKQTYPKQLMEWIRFSCFTKITQKHMTNESKI